MFIQIEIEIGSYPPGYKFFASRPVQISNILMESISKCTEMASDTVSYRIANNSDFDTIEAFILKHFVTTEPTSQALSLTGNAEFKNFVRPMIQSCLVDPTSYIAVNKVNDIVGVRLNRLCILGESQSTREKDDGAKKLVQDANARLSSDLNPLSILETYLDRIEAGYEVLIPQSCDKIIKFVILCVNTVEYGRRGIASKLVELSMENARALGCTGALATLTAYASQCLFLKANFEILKVINHEAFVDDNGKRLINCQDGTNQGQLVFKRIAQ